MDNWKRPSQLKFNLRTEIQIILVPTGEIVSASVERCLVSVIDKAIKFAKLQCSRTWHVSNSCVTPKLYKASDPSSGRVGRDGVWKSCFPNTFCVRKKRILRSEQYFPVWSDWEALSPNAPNAVFYNTLGVSLTWSIWLRPFFRAQPNLCFTIDWDLAQAWIGAC